MLKSRTYIPKLLNLRYITLVITHIYIKYHSQKYQFLKFINPKTTLFTTSELNLPNLSPQANLCSNLFPFKHLHLNSSYDR